MLEDLVGAVVVAFDIEGRSAAENEADVVSMESSAVVEHLLVLSSADFDVTSRKHNAQHCIMFP